MGNVSRDGGRGGKQPGVRCYRLDGSWRTRYLFIFLEKGVLKVLPEGLWQRGLSDSREGSLSYDK